MLTRTAIVGDPTLFTEVSQTYDKIVNELLQPEEDPQIDGVPERLITQFRKIYGSGAYRCRAIACSYGFKSIAQRSEHEALAHPVIYYCSKKSCKYSKSPGFLTLSGRDLHVRTQHPIDDSREDMSPRHRKASKHHRLEDACGLEENDPEIDKLLEMVLSKNGSNEIASDSPPMGEPNAEANRVSTEQQHPHGPEEKHVAEADEKKPAQPEQEQPDEPDPSGTQAEPLETGIIDLTVEAEPLRESEPAAIPSSYVDDRDLALLSAAIQSLSKGPMTIGEIGNEMGPMSYDHANLLVLLWQIADEQDGKYHLKSGVTDELHNMMHSQTEADRKQDEPTEKATEQNDDDVTQ